MTAYRWKLTRRQYTETAGQTSDGQPIGGATITYPDAEKLWADIRERTAQEKARYGATFSTVLAEITIRDHPDLDPKDRLYDPFTGDVWYILGTRREYAPRKLIVDAEKGGPER